MAPPAAPVRPPSLADMPVLGRLRFFLFGRGFPALFFGWIAWNQLNHVVNGIGVFRASASPHNLASLLPDTVYLLFCAIPVGVYLSRPVPRSRDGSLPARTAAMLGTTVQLIIGVFPDEHQLWRSSTLQLWVATPVLILAFSFAVVTLLSLRRNLSIIPEARGLVTSGPYRLVRHPLYLAEITAAVGRVIGGAALLQLLSLGALIALQMIRTGYEERLLSRTFSEYAGYAARTRRIIPGVW